MTLPVDCRSYMQGPCEAMTEAHAVTWLEAQHVTARRYVCDKSKGNWVQGCGEASARPGKQSFGEDLKDLAELIYKHSGAEDVVGCATGSGIEACAWTAAAILPFGLGRAAKALATGAKLGDDSIEAAIKAACSFDGDTQILMADGTTKPIAEIQIGDQVLAADPETGEHGPRTVTAVFAHDDTVLELATEDGATVTTTEDHPFYNTTDQAWQRADQLDPGDSLLSSSRQLVRVRGQIFGTARVAVAYNFTVNDLHTYYVMAGDTPVLVHNTCPTGSGTAGANITQKGLDHSFDRHAAQWFGRSVTKADKMGEWNSLIERAAGSSKVVPWSSGSTATYAHIARIDGKWFVAQFDRSSGNLVTAFVPNNGQVGAMLELIGK